MWETLFEAAKASKGIPVCQSCGELWMDIQVPDWQNPGQTKSKRVRKLCPCQESELVAAEQAQKALNRWTNFNAAFKRVMPPKAYAGVMLAQVEEREGSKAGKAAATLYVETWAARRANGQGLILAGPWGTGKTLVASAIANELDARHQTVIFLTVVDLQARVRDFDSAKEFVRACHTVDLLVLDDFGIEKATEWAVAELFGIIDARYRDKAPIIITTNLGRQALTDHYVRCLTHGKDKMPQAQAELTINRILSRLRERCATVVFKGSDQRENTTHDWLS